MTAKGEAQSTVHIDTFRKDLIQYRNDAICMHIQISVRPKSLFWFRSDTKTATQIGQYFQLISQPIPRYTDGENLVNDSMRYFFPS